MITPDAGRLRGDFDGVRPSDHNVSAETAIGGGKGFAMRREGQLFADADITKPLNFQIEQE